LDIQSGDVVVAGTDGFSTAALDAPTVDVTDGLLAVRDGARPGSETSS